MTRTLLASTVPVRPGRPTLLLALAACGLVACGAPIVEGTGRPLPAFAGRSTELFDDSIEASAVGIALDPTGDPRADRTLRERAQVGDAVVRARVTTVTAKQEDQGTHYIVGLQSLETLAGRFPPKETFELVVGRTSPSAGIFKRLESAVVGKTFVAFIRTFVRPDGDAETHFHLAPDTKEEAGAVRDAAALQGL